MKKIFLLIILLVVGCAQVKDFKYGIKQINNINAKYNATMEEYPKTTSQINLMLSEYGELKNLKLEKGQEPFNYIINYRILNLEAEKLYAEGKKYGETGTTKDGFGCKQRPFVIESVSFRNRSALKGFEAVDLLRELVNKYPEEAGLANLSLKNALFLNATFYQISREARTDSNVINNFCPKNVTLEVYQQEFRKKANFSEDFISNLSYEKAVDIWKEIRGFS